MPGAQTPFLSTSSILLNQVHLIVSSMIDSVFVAIGWRTSGCRGQDMVMATRLYGSAAIMTHKSLVSIDLNRSDERLVSRLRLGWPSRQHVQTIITWRSQMKHEAKAGPHIALWPNNECLLVHACLTNRSIEPSDSRLLTFGSRQPDLQLNASFVKRKYHLLLPVLLFLHPIF